MTTPTVFILTLSVENAAFDDGMATEIARILHDLADRIAYGGTPECKLCDVNGNIVGSARFQ